jgi:hypothetical protein
MLPVVYLPQAERYLKKLKDKHLKDEFKKAIFRIRENPRIGEAKSGDLRGIFSLDVFHMPVKIMSLLIVFQSLRMVTLS